MRRVGVLGSGEVGQTLAGGFRKHGYDVRIGSRDPGKLAEFSRTAGVSAGTFREVAAWGELLALAVHGAAATRVIELAGPENFAGKTVIDTTNPLSDAPPVDGVLQLFTGPNSSLMEELQRACPEANFVKSFSSVGSARMVNPQFGGGPPTMFICGNNDRAKAEVRGVLDQFGWETADMGSVVAARAIEPLAALWCIPGFRNDSWTHAFKVLWK